MSIDIRQRHKRPSSGNPETGSLGGSTLLSLSLFVILLAFFIVLNAISFYSKPKVEGVFDSLELAFAKEIVPTNFDNASADERDVNAEGQGDSLEDIQGLLKSILPGLDSVLTENPDGGKIMSIRMEKDKFARLSSQLLPVFARVLAIKDGDHDYHITMVSSVRDTTADDAYVSYRVLQDYKQAMLSDRLTSDRVYVSINQGNPAFLQFRFEKTDGGL